ncbi:MAG: SprT-like family protein [Tenericutes bacterium ADurb.Bin024]|jgi:predicted metal-dependent hydrolase|nr:MAG: SprT-like family protein [Tenericutes bacterium ADurb.Bin024]
MFNHTISVNTKNGVVNYTLSLTYKRMKTIVFRPCETQENTFNVSLPYGTRISKLEEVFMKNYKSLLRLQKKTSTVPFSDTTYIFGEEKSLNDIKIKYNLKEVPTSLEHFYALTKKLLLSHLEESVKHYSKIMNIPVTYKVRVKRMKTRWGSNSKHTMSLSFNEKLIHFHPRIINALVVHELVHYFVSGHGPKFYKLLEKYEPNYKNLDRVLKEQCYEYNNE